jgi:hypothetical protein
MAGGIFRVTSFRTKLEAGVFVGDFADFMVEEFKRLLAVLVRWNEHSV